MGRDSIPSPDPRRWWGLTALAISVLLVTLDNTILALAIPSLVEDLDPTPTEMLWIGDAYSFVLAALLVTMGNVGDRFGRKKTLFTGSVAFAILSVLAAFSPTAGALILARAAMGVAGATLMPSTLSMIRNMFGEPKERRIAVSIWTAMGAIGAGLGPLIGGVLLEHFWWGSVFLVNVPVVALVLAIGAWSLRESRNPDAGPFDLVSVALSTVGIFASVFAFKELAISGTDNIEAWGIGGIGLLCLAAFVRRQLRLEYPLVDVRLFKIPAFAGAAIADTLSAFGLIGVYFFLSQKFQFVEGFAPLKAGVMLLPAQVAAVIAAPVAVRVINREGRRTAICGGLFLGGLGLSIIGVAPTDGPYIVSLGLVLVGFGFGLSLTGTGDAILASAPADRAGAAAAVAETCFELGAALGIAVLGTLLAAWYRHGVEAPKGLEPSQVGDLTDSISSALRLAAELPPELAEQINAAAKAAFAAAFSVTCLSAALVMLFALVLSYRVLPSRREEQKVPADH